jgi:hypothetical protein
MENLKLEGTIRLKCFYKDGRLKWDTGFIKNTITTAGMAQLALLAGDASAVPFTYLAVGTTSTTPTSANTALLSEVTNHGLARAEATVSRVTTTNTNDTLQLVYTWTASGGSTDIIQEIGIFNDASAGTMLGRALTGAKSITSGETLQATYKVKFS